MMNQDFVQLVADPFRVVLHRVLSQVPSFAAAFLFVLIGLFVARLLRSVVERALERAKIDDAVQKVGVGEVLARLGMGKSLGYVVGFLVYWFVLFAFFVSAANAVNLAAVSELLERFMLFLPSVIAAILILFGGLMFARFLSQVVANASSANDIRGGDVLAKAAYVVIVVFSTLMAMEQLGIQMLLLASSVQIILASLGLAFALAFGLGGKEVAAEIIRDILKRDVHPHK
ncbi:MAG: hypothetical protein WC969_09880 [Elusimicrobiota bacterium]|jgi:hypothetical protein